MESENKTKFPIFWIILSVMLFMVYFIIWWTNRAKGMVKVIQYCIYLTMIIGVVGVLIFLVLWLLRKQKVDMIHIMRQRITKACQMCAPKKQQQIYFRGSDLIEYRYIGDVVGIAKAQTEPVYEKVKDEKTGELKHKMIKKPMDITFIAFEKPVIFPLSLFTSPDIFVGLTDKINGKVVSDYTHLSGDIIYLNGMTFAPELYGLYFLSQHFKDTFMIDEVAKELIYRYGLQDNLSEFKNIFDDVLAISPEHRKQIETSKIHQITGE